MFVFITILVYIIGFGILRRLDFYENKVEMFGLAFPLGLGIGTLAILFMDILGIPLTLFSMAILFVFLGIVLNYREARQISQFKWPALSNIFVIFKRISLVEWIFLGFLFFLYFISFWRCYYLPITPYDSIVGIDLVAKYAVEAGRMDSQMFAHLADYMSTQPYYAPFAALSQIIYRLAGHSFGKIWLTFMYLSLIIVVYINLRKEIHTILAGLFTIVLMAIPEMYAYTFMVQTDFSNAVFVSLSVIYLFHFIKKKQMAYLWIASILFGLGAWSRSETIAFAASTTVLLFLFLYFESTKKSDVVKYCIYFFGISFFFFAIWNLFYLPYLLKYSPESYFKFGFWDANRLQTLWDGMIGILTNTLYWGYIPYLFLVVTIVNLLFFRDKHNLFILSWIIFLFISFLIVLYHLQLPVNANINNTFRRGTFKFWPIMIFYMGTSALMVTISDKIKKWESA